MLFHRKRIKHLFFPISPRLCPAVGPRRGSQMPPKPPGPEFGKTHQISPNLRTKLPSIPSRPFPKSSAQLGPKCEPCSFPNPWSGTSRIQGLNQPLFILFALFSDQIQNIHLHQDRTLTFSPPNIFKLLKLYKHCNNRNIPILIYKEVYFFLVLLCQYCLVICHYF